MTRTKNKLLWGAIGIAFLAVLFSLAIGLTPTRAQPSSISAQATATATTTAAFIGNGTATSTYQVDSGNVFSSTKAFTMSGIDSVYLYVQAAASSSATIYGFTVQLSNNNIDWYAVATTSLANTSFSFSSTTAATFVWQPGTTATSGIMFKLPDVAGLHERILTSATGAAGAVYEEVILKKNPSNP